MSRRADSVTSFSPVVAIASLVLAACFSYLVIDVFGQDGQRNADSHPYGGDAPVDNTADAAYHDIAVNPRDDYDSGDVSATQKDNRYEYAVSPKPATGGFVASSNTNSSGRNVTSADRRLAWPVYVDETTQAPPVTNSSSDAESLFPGVARKSANVGTQAESLNEASKANSANTTPANAQPNLGSEASPLPFDSSPVGQEQQQELMAEVAVDLDEMQKIRCYPIDNQGGPPCMCELTIIKQGQTQSELIDNCN